MYVCLDKQIIVIVVRLRGATCPAEISQENHDEMLQKVSREGRDIASYPASPFLTSLT